VLSAPSFLPAANLRKDGERGKKRGGISLCRERLLNTMKNADAHHRQQIAHKLSR